MRKSRENFKLLKLLNNLNEISKEILRFWKYVQKSSTHAIIKFYNFFYWYLNNGRAIETVSLQQKRHIILLLIIYKESFSLNNIFIIIIIILILSCLV